MSNPKYSWIVAQVISGNTIVLGNEDRPLWQAKEWGVKLAESLQNQEKHKVVIITEQLEQVDDPVALLRQAKEKGDIINMTIPNEYGWSPQFKPFANAKHKRHYDIELLCQHLEEAGLIYKIELLDYGGWSFFVVQAK